MLVSHTLIDCVSQPHTLCDCVGQITLEFYERKKGRWLLPAENVNWEVWHLTITIAEPPSEEGRLPQRPLFPLLPLTLHIVYTSPFFHSSPSLPLLTHPLCFSSSSSSHLYLLINHLRVAGTPAECHRQAHINSKCRHHQQITTNIN